MAEKKSINVISQELGNEIFGEGNRSRKRARPSLTHKEAAREIPVFAECDVLVIGGGPSGTAAAVAAGRMGADVMLIERYNHLGGLSTGGLVIWIDRMTDWSGRQVIAGFAADVLDRLPKDGVLGPTRSDWGSKDVEMAAYWANRASAFQGVVTWSPTVDPEALKSLSMQMLLEQKVRLTLHSWAVMPLVEDGALQGAIFESKEGRQAVLAKVVVDTTGDADLLARAGVPTDSDTDATDIHHCMNTAFLLGGVDMERWNDFRTNDKAAFARFTSGGRAALKSFERPQFGWRNDVALFMGPRLSGYSAVDVEDLTEVEIRSRQLTIGHLEYFKAHAPGFENAFLMLGAPQVGVRHSRRFAAANKVTRAQWDEGQVWSDEIGVSTSLAPKWKNISVPYGSLVPIGLDGALGAGRHVACDASSHTFLREIPQCWMTGQAAGVAAAVAVNDQVQPRDVDVRAVQRELLKQGVYLSPSVASDVIATPFAAE